jgi:hypothetical protein
MNLENIKKGDQFSYLGGTFTIGHIYSDGLMYIKSPEGDISEMLMEEFKSKVRNGTYQIVTP